MSEAIRPRPEMTPELIGRLAELAGVPLAPERRAELVPFADELVQGFERLRRVALGPSEPPPGAAALDARATV